MSHRKLALGCLLLALASRAAEQPFMALFWGGPGADAPASSAQLIDALNRYPTCFDTVRFAARQPDGQTVEALRKMGIAAETVERRSAARGFDDRAPRAMIGNALLLAAVPGHGDMAAVGTGRQCASGKTAYGLCVESMLDLAFGASSLEFDLMGYAHEPASWYANTYLSELTVWRPFYQAYVRFNQGTKPGGILPFCGKNGAPQLDGTLKAADTLAPIGLPLCPGSPWPVCYMLNAEAVDSMSAVDLQRVLSGAVLLDGGAVSRLQARGCGATLQLTAALRAPEVSEVFTDDELNVNRVGYVWRPDASKDNTYALYPSNEAARVIGRYQLPDGKAAEAASVLIETQMGARIAAFGFAGFSSDISAARRRQLMLAADWLSQNTLPVLVETVSQAVVVPRVTQAGDLRSVTVLNASIDVQQPLTLRLRGLPEPLERMEWVTPVKKPVTIAVRHEAKDALVIIPPIGAWEIGWLRPAE